MKLGFTSFSYSHFDLFDELLQLTVQLLQTPCYFRVVDILCDIDFLTLFLVFCSTRSSSWWWSLEYCCRWTNNFLFFRNLEGKAINVCSLFVTDIVIVIITTAPSSELESFSSNISKLFYIFGELFMAFALTVDVVKNINFSIPVRAIWAGRLSWYFFASSTGLEINTCKLTKCELFW